MKNNKYNIATFPDLRDGFFDQKTKGYIFFFVGEDLSKEAIATSLDGNEVNWNTNHWELFFEKNKIVSIGLVKKQNQSRLNEEVEIISQKIDLGKSHFAVLVEYQDPNIFRSRRTKVSEEAFMISTYEFLQFYTKDISTGLCYHFMIKALEDKGRLEQIIVHQIKYPNPQFIDVFKPIKNIEIIMPHRGDTNALEAALWYLENQKVNPKKVSVCFDEVVTDRHFSIVEKNKNVRFFVNYPAGVGPYPSRDVLARTTDEEVILFHDSDDVSTSDRTATLLNFLDRNNLDAAGSHELRIDKIKKRIIAFRFPLKVIKATGKQVPHSIFFPTTAIKKSAYLKAGGLSTVRRHSSDSQFYKRAYFFLNIENVDEFLYIRIKHENSLTTGKATALGSPVRERLKSQWESDFVKVQNQNISLLESTLIDEYNNVDVDVIPLSEKNRTAILSWQELNSSIQKQSLSNKIENKGFPDAKDILEERILDFRLVKDPGVDVLKQSFSWRIGWSITRMIIRLFGWIPFVKRRL